MHEITPSAQCNEPLRYIGASIINKCPNWGVPRVLAVSRLIRSAQGAAVARAVARMAAACCTSEAYTLRTARLPAALNWAGPWVAGRTQSAFHCQGAQPCALVRVATALASLAATAPRAWCLKRMSMLEEGGLAHPERATAPAPSLPATITPKGLADELATCRDLALLGAWRALPAGKQESPHQPRPSV